MISSYLKKLNQLAKAYSKASGYSKTRLICFYLWNLLIYRMSLGEYFKLQHFRHNGAEKRLYLGNRNDKKIRLKKLNTLETLRILGDKRLTNIEYKQYVKRKWVVGNDNFDRVRSFIYGISEVIVKPLDAYGGADVRLLKVTTEAEKEKFLEEISEYKNCLLEERVYNHSAIQTLSPGCLNTVRIYTAIDSTGELTILACGLRMGTGSYVDNAAQGGIFAPIDYKSGSISKYASNYLGEKFSFHPISGQRISGFVLPNWELLKNCINEIVKVHPEARYVGWDLAILEDRIEVIEGNADGGTDLLQLLAEKGMLKTLKGLI